MKLLPTLIRPRDTADRPRTAAECAESIAKLEAERTAAVEQLAAMSAERLALLGDETVPVERLLDHDARAVQTAIRRDRAAVQADRLEVERQAAEVREEGERRSAIYERGRKAERDREKLMAGEYIAAAKALVAIVDRAHALSKVIEEANGNRPDGAERLGPGEPSNGYPGEPGYYVQGRPMPYRYNRANGQRIGPAGFDEADTAATVVRHVPQEPSYHHPILGKAHEPLLSGLVVPGLDGKNLFPRVPEV